MSDKKDPKLTFRSDELAVPEVLTGEVDETEELEEDQEEIRYDTVAIPEIHIGRRKPEK
ncbi:hypothetical protein [Colidextribacter sp. OB.20]|uniref:hypothetical protein n=1 Tax=Colidextribacter sp. OB.20 TaxID=2304568 RepID=UPI00191BF9A0|nr:hypothetical protein [Colidextribacter sp. OB.20]